MMAIRVRGAVDSFDAAELDVAGGARAADEGDQARRIQQGQALGDAFHDIRDVHDTHGMSYGVMIRRP